MSGATGSISVPHDIPFLDILDPAFDFGSTEVAQAREKSWCARTTFGLLVLRYADVQELMRDPRLDHNGKRYMEMNGVFDGPAYDWFVPMIVNHDGEHHRRLRGLVNKAFTPRTISNLRPFIRTVAEERAEHLPSVEVCEFLDDFANPLPLAVMCELLGVHAEDYGTFREWTTDIGLVFSIAHGGDIVTRVNNAVVGLYGYVDSLMADKRANPADDLISVLVAAQHADGDVTTEELRNLIVTLVFAAHDTTRHQLANALVTFAEHPDQWDLLARHPELVPQAVEEVMRWHPSSPTIYRFAAQDLDFHGLHITEGTQLMMAVPVAQRDPRTFGNGGSFDITIEREALPLQFGGGPHHCLGSALARAELGEALPALTSRLGAPSIAGPVTWRLPMGIYGPNMLPLRFGRS